VGRIVEKIRNILNTLKKVSGLKLLEKNSGEEFPVDWKIG